MYCFDRHCIHRIVVYIVLANTMAHAFRHHIYRNQILFLIRAKEQQNVLLRLETKKIFFWDVIWSITSSNWNKSKKINGVKYLLEQIFHIYGVLRTCVSLRSKWMIYMWLKSVYRIESLFSSDQFITYYLFYAIFHIFRAKQKSANCLHFFSHTETQGMFHYHYRNVTIF